MLMQLQMMFTAEWDGKFVADLPAKRPGFCEFEMMASHGERRQTIHGCAATNARWALLRFRIFLVSGKTNLGSFAIC